MTLVESSSEDDFANQGSPSPSIGFKRWKAKTQLVVAIQYNDLDTARTILTTDFGQGLIDPDDCYTSSFNSHLSAICLAIDRGFHDMTKLLIEHGASVNRFSSGMSPIHYAARKGSAEILKTLILERANVNSVSHCGYTPLHLAAQTNSLESIEILILAGANYEKKDLDGRTPLSIACIFNQTKIVELLIKHGANVNTLDKNDNSPLLHGIESDLYINSRLVKLLLDSGANPDQVNNRGQTALIQAVRRCTETNLEGDDTVNELISHGCEINTIGPCGASAMHVAIARGQDRIVETLIRSGCDASIKDAFGFTPLDCLVAHGKMDLVSLIVASGNKTQLPKNSWKHLSDRLCLSNEEQFNPLRHFIVSLDNKLPRLKNLCRCKIRQMLGRNADFIITNHLLLPVPVKRFLLMWDL